MVGSFIAHRVRKKISNPQTIIAYSVLISGIFLIPLIHNVYIITVSWTIITTLGSINVVTYFTERQKRVSKDILARVVSVSRMIAYFAIPFGAILGGYLKLITS